MVKFFMKCFFLLSLLLFGVLMGMQQAQKGIISLKGEDPSIEKPLNVEVDQNGQVSATVLGKELSEKEMKEKQEQLKETDGYHALSKTGKAISVSVTSAFQQMLRAFFANEDQ